MKNLFRKRDFKCSRQQKQALSQVCLSRKKSLLLQDLGERLALLKLTKDPLVRHESEGVTDVINNMDKYDIIKDDFDSIMEITKYPNSRDPLSKLTTKTKAAFTRAYNKGVHLTPYSTGTMSKKRRGRAATEIEEEELYGEGEEETHHDESDDDEADDLSLDTMIKAKKKPASKKGGSEKTSDVKGKGKGKGKGKS